jgi:pimeloyl-ACP methyl ester carboxylesterase
MQTAGEQAKSANHDSHDNPDSDGLEIPGAKHRRVDVGEVTLHCVEAGSGPLVVLLHGFPEFWWSWRHQIPALAKAGFRVVAPDLRGYNLSDKPRGVKAYAVEKLVTDVAGLITALGEERAHVVGHDWGGAVAWSFAMFRPELLRKLSVLNCPHPAEMLRGLRTWKQMKKSWYMFFFQLPGLPERWIAADDYKFLRNALGGGAATKDDVERYVEAAKRGDRLEGGINYYRASLRAAALGALPPFKLIEARTLVIWGERDLFLGKELAQPSERWVKDVRVERLPEATHWVQVDAPARVNELLVDFLRDS